MYFLYNILLILFAPIWLPWMLWRTFQRKQKPRWDERTGNYRHIQIPKEKPAIWVHAVSVGEVIAVLPVLREVRKLLPDHFIVLSVTTSSGHRTAEEHAVDLYDALVYFPVDLARFQLSAMMRVRPDVVAIMETELWFNFLWAAKAVGASTLLINGRISDRSFSRSKHLKFFYKPLLSFVDACLMQTEEDASRIRELGAKNVKVVGNVKFDVDTTSDQDARKRWIDDLGLNPELPTLVVGSSRGEEEEQFIFKAIADVEIPYNLVWAPRHLERSDAVHALLKTKFERVARRGAGERGQIQILDTYGELSGVYQAADLVVIGGSFVNLGGQNLIQPLAVGKPVIHGVYMQNFKEATRAAKEAGATVECATTHDLSSAITGLLKDGKRREEMGQAGQRMVESSRGASLRYAKAIQQGVSMAEN